MRATSSVPAIVVFLFTLTGAASAQQPQPSQTRVTASDATSWTIQVTDPDGVYFVDPQYGYLPRLYSWKDFAANCPTTAQFRILKKRRFLLRSLPLYDFSVIDCSGNEGGKSIVSHFKITPQDATREYVKAHGRSRDEQALLDKFDLMEINREIDRITLRIILFLLALILLLFLWLLWRGFGPFRRQ